MKTQLIRDVWWPFHSNVIKFFRMGELQVTMLWAYSVAHMLCVSIAVCDIMLCYNAWIESL